MPDLNQQETLERFLLRSFRKGSHTLEALEALALEAFAKQSDGTTTVEVTFEGGASRAQVNCPPSVLLAALENVIAAVDPSNPNADVTPGARYADFSGSRIET